MKMPYINLDEEAKQVEEITQAQLSANEKEKQEALWQSYANVLERYEKGDPSAVDDLLAFRLHDATQHNMGEASREEAIKEGELARRRDERRRQGIQQGQSVQEFYRELNKTTLNDFKAEEQDRKEIGLPVQKAKPTAKQKFEKVQSKINQSVSIPKMPDYSRGQNTSVNEQWGSTPFLRKIGQIN